MALDSLSKRGKDVSSPTGKRNLRGRVIVWKENPGIVMPRLNEEGKEICEQC